MASKGKELYPHLFEPMRIGNLRLKNRIISAPTSPSMIDCNGHFSREMLAYLEEKAKGGVSMVTYGEGIVHSSTGKSHNTQLQLDSFGVRQGLVSASRVIHNNGAYANIQLSHGGKYGGLVSVGGSEDRPKKAYGPSHEVTPVGEVFEMPKELILEIVDSYGKAAALVKDCGFDMVQVHAAHGWLFSQFLSPVQNKRTDEFGGSLENRARFLLLALDSVRAVVGPEFPIEIRLSGDDCSEDGLSQEDCMEVAKMVDDKVDLINVSCGNHEDPELFCRTHPSAFFKRGVNVYLAAEIKKHVKSPVACVGALNNPAHMEEIIKTGQADFVEIGRALLADPNLANKAFSGQADDITPCLRCYECFGETIKSQTIKCTVNPTMGQQLTECYVRKAPIKKKVLIAGGGPAGMQAALTAVKRGHEVILAEKSDVLGGNLIPAGVPSFKQDIALYRKVLIRRIEHSKVQVMLNTNVDRALVERIKPDVLIVAIGSVESKPPIKGMNLPNVVMAIDAEMNQEKLGKKVVIMGGGLVGAELAISLHENGRECAIVEMKEDIAEEVNQLYRGGLMPHVKESAQIYTSTKIKEILSDGVLCEKDEREVKVEGDTVVCALGFKVPVAEVEELAALVDDYYIIGDCAKVGQIYQAVNQGYYTALRL